nr:calcipressin-like protein [Quercus suber]
MATMTMEMSSPPSSASSLSRRHSHALSLDLSDLPPLSQPSPPSNTLLITNLQAPEIFSANILENIRKSINEHAVIHAFSPLKSMRRIICTFYTIDEAVAIRQVLDGESVLGSRVRVYFGQNTKIDLEDQHLPLPPSQKLFFISPPPSPPVGWEMRNEEPPNKEVHAEDLVQALSRLHARPEADAALHDEQEQTRPMLKVSTRQRSGTGTLVYDPEEHGHSPDLPAIAVEDTSASPTELSAMDVDKKFVHTARPPVELME